MAGSTDRRSGADHGRLAANVLPSGSAASSASEPSS